MLLLAGTRWRAERSRPGARRAAHAVTRPRVRKALLFLALAGEGAETMPPSSCGAMASVQTVLAGCCALFCVPRVREAVEPWQSPWGVGAICHFYIWGNWGAGRLSDLANCIAGVRARTRTWAVSVQSPGRWPRRPAERGDWRTPKFSPSAVSLDVTLEEKKNPKERNFRLFFLTLRTTLSS